MLRLQRTDDTEVVSVPLRDKPIEDLLNKEWLLTNARGGYASSTIVGCNTRRYHGLLIGSLNPPANRLMALANCLEILILNGGRAFGGAHSKKLQNGSPGSIFNLSTFEFNEKFAPEGFSYIKRFRQDTGAHFDYQLDNFQLTKSIYLLREKDTVAIVYDFTGLQQPAEFVLRPFIGLRDFHTLQKSYARVSSTFLGPSLLVRHDVPNSCGLFLSCPSMNFEKDQQWWFNFIYRNDRERGQDFTEDLWTPGFFKCRIDSPTEIVFWANLSNQCEPEQLINPDIKAVREDLQKHQSIVIASAQTKDKKAGLRFAKRGQNSGCLIKLCLAADQFITKRAPTHEPRTTILAGFPWFADWGRDAFIALPGLLLSTGRFEEAKSVLTTFAQAADDGLIPNRFDERSGTAYFNSIDASLWFINAAFRYLEATEDSESFTQQLLPTILCIIDSFHNGTRFDTHADADGLITAGNDVTQLTWMDAKYDGVAFTPRFGKAVEINALWYNSLCRLAQFYAGRDAENTEHYKSLADKVAASFCQLFWNDTTGCLNDCILPDGSVDASLRPNQIFAVSLPFSPLPLQKQKSVVEVVQRELLTPYGLRTLAASDGRYKGTYTGPQRERDEAYHQGTVWPFLIGPFVESWMKMNGFNRKNKKKAAEFIQPLMQHLTDDGCLGQLCEIFDGDPPHKPKGCIAQAWSVAELIRMYYLINS